MAQKIQEIIKEMGDKTKIKVANLKNKVANMGEKKAIAMVATLLVGAISLSSVANATQIKNANAEEDIKKGANTKVGVVLSDEERVANVTDRFLGLTDASEADQKEFIDKVKETEPSKVLNSMQDTVNELASGAVEASLESVEENSNNQPDESQYLQELLSEIYSLSDTLTQIEEDIVNGVRTDYNSAVAQANKTANLLTERLDRYSVILEHDESGHIPAVNQAQQMKEASAKSLNNIIRSAMSLQLETAKAQVFESGCGEFLIENNMNGNNDECYYQVDKNNNKAVVVSSSSRDGSLVMSTLDGLKSTTTDGNMVIEDVVANSEVYDPATQIDEFLKDSDNENSTYKYNAVDGYSIQRVGEDGKTIDISVKITNGKILITSTRDGDTLTLTANATTPERIAEDSQYIQSLIEQARQNAGEAEQ